MSEVADAVARVDWPVAKIPDVKRLATPKAPVDEPVESVVCPDTARLVIVVEASVEVPVTVKRDNVVVARVEVPVAKRPVVKRLSAVRPAHDEAEARYV